MFNAGFDLGVPFGAMRIRLALLLLALAVLAPVVLALVDPP